MSGRVLRGLVAGIAAGACLTASAHEFECAKRIAVLPLATEASDAATQSVATGVPIELGLVAGLPFTGSADVTTYPAVVFWRVDLVNVATDATSIVKEIEESVVLPPEIPHLPWGVWPVPGLGVPAGETLTFGMAARIQTYEDCLALAGAATGGSPDLDEVDRVENVFGVVYDGGFASCRARLVCVPPDPVPVLGATAEEVTP